MLKPIRLAIIAAVVLSLLALSLPIPYSVLGILIYCAAAVSLWRGAAWGAFISFLWLAAQAFLDIVFAAKAWQSVDLEQVGTAIISVTIGAVGAWIFYRAVVSIDTEKTVPLLKAKPNLPKIIIGGALLFIDVSNPWNRKQPNLLNLIVAVLAMWLITSGAKLACRSGRLRNQLPSKQ